MYIYLSFFPLVEYKFLKPENKIWKSLYLNYTKQINLPKSNSDMVSYHMLELNLIPGSLWNYKSLYKLSNTINSNYNSSTAFIIYKWNHQYTKICFFPTIKSKISWFAVMETSYDHKVPSVLGGHWDPLKILFCTCPQILCMLHRLFVNLNVQNTSLKFDENLFFMCECNK